MSSVVGGKQSGDELEARNGRRIADLPAGATDGRECERGTPSMGDAWHAWMSAIGGLIGAGPSSCGLANRPTVDGVKMKRLSAVTRVEIGRLRRSDTEHGHGAELGESSSAVRVVMHGQIGICGHTVTYLPTFAVPRWTASGIVRLEYERILSAGSSLFLSTGNRARGVPQFT
ncbi:hypothetical protein Tco_0341266 [Tanacetum coccineum]